MQAKKIGTVEVTRLKVYPLDGQARHDASSLDMVVQPGVYELWRLNDTTTFWMPEGQINLRNIRLGDGMFVMYPEDVPLEGPIVRVPTRMMGEQEYAEFLAGAPEWGLIVKEDR